MFDTFDTFDYRIRCLPFQALKAWRSVQDPMTQGGMLCGSSEMFGRRYFLRRCEGTQNQMGPISSDQSRLSRHQAKHGIDWGPKVPAGFYCQLYSFSFSCFFFFFFSLAFLRQNIAGIYGKCLAFQYIVLLLPPRGTLSFYRSSNFKYMAIPHTPVILKLSAMVSRSIL